MIWFILGAVAVIMGIAYLSFATMKPYYADEWDDISTPPKPRKQRSDAGKKRKPYTKRSTK